ncbi:MAG: ASCH domain-containing protein [Spirochaetales bacterium]|nr:ASCH domain-containing protein [Spirochaetales bacterium]MBO7349371.1 ASCH domain-containing protein [Spirochaetales bacterium]
MTAEEMWRQSGLSGEYEAWSFGGNPDKLADLVLKGEKTATCSALCFYEMDNDPIPAQGDYSVILNSKDEAVCIIETTKVYLSTFDQVTPSHALKEGEGDKSLDYWRKVHEEFFTDELKEINMKFDRNMSLVCEEFEVVWPKKA